ncbi:CHAT domain-containing protein [Nonomuraea sp. NPDC005650]|uniref:CHAT domain-containing protein n=1 Tax=Nonomuraea sp. NPDC005650 TaxID=3157045 RepID=UPI0033B68BD4
MPRDLPEFEIEAVVVWRGRQGDRLHTLVVVDDGLRPTAGDTLAALLNQAAAQPGPATDTWIAVRAPVLPGEDASYGLHRFPQGDGLPDDELVPAALGFLDAMEPTRQVEVSGPFKGRKGRPAYLLRAEIDARTWQFVLVTRAGPPRGRRLRVLCRRLADAAVAAHEPALLIDTWIVDERLELFPYHRPPGTTDRALALDAVKALTARLRISGPYRLAGMGFRAHLITGQFARATHQVCYLEPDTGDTPPLTESAARPLFLRVLGEVPVTQPEWPAARIWAVYPHTGDVWTTLAVPPVSRHRRRNAEAVLFLYGTSILRSPTVEWPAWAQAGQLRKFARKHGLRVLQVQPKDGLPRSLIMTQQDDVGEVGDAAAEADLYLRETISFIEEERLLPAFRSYVYHRYLVPPSTSEEVSASIAVGLRLADRLLDEDRFDHAEWAAAWVATLAEQAGRHDEARVARRIAAISCEYLGWVDEAVTHVTAALGNPAGFADPLVEDLLNMSAGISLTIAFSDHEPERRYLSPLDEESRTLLERAAAHLERAREGYAAHLERAGEGHVAGQGAEAERSLRTIELYRWRVIDLLGDHAAAAQHLFELAKAPDLAHDEALAHTAGWFMLAALRKRAYTEPIALRRFAEEMEQHTARTQAYGLISASKETPVYVMGGDLALDVGEPQVAYALFQAARQGQRAGYVNQIRPPRPRETHGGWMAIDVIGRLARIATRHPEVVQARPLEVLLEIENAKSRWFRRDLVLGLPNRLPAARADAGEPAAELPWEALADPRVDLAERAWQGEQDEPPAIVDEEAVRALWRRLPERTALMSFYSGAHETFLAVLRDPDGPPAMLRLPLPAGRLERVVTRMQAYFSAAGLFGAVDPRDPGRHHARFLSGLDEVGEALAAALPYLEDRELVVALPHQQWHNLPVHALLLPRLWRRGHRPGWTYAPSLGMLDFLMSRSAAREDPRFVRAGVTTAPRPGDDLEAMGSAHHALVRVLTGSFSSIRETFGERATVEAFQQTTRSVVLHHLLAHGAFHDTADVMRSGFALSPAPGGPDGALLSGRDLMRHGTRAAHVTLQACSLGRGVSAASDEMWGPTRAFLAAGADTVAAPLWDVDLASSTRVLEEFYRLWLRDGVPKWRALADAQHAMYDDPDRPEWRHLYHWSAFKLIGC